MPSLSRRRLLQVASLSVLSGALAGRPTRVLEAAMEPVTLGVFSRSIDVNGKPASVLAVAQADGTAGLSAETGERFRVRLVNELDKPTLVHWHGLTPPSEQDGVPGLSQPALAPGGSYDYDFLHNRAGTFWMHSHVGLQEQQLLAAPLTVRDPEERMLDEQEVVLLLHDFTFRDPEEILHELRAGGTAMAMGGSAGHLEEEPQAAMNMGQAGHDEASQQGAMEMGGSSHGGATDGAGDGAMVHYNDIDHDAYLANDRKLSDPEVVRVETGGRVRLRIINGAAATNLLLDLGHIEGELVAVDGNPVMPVSGRYFDLAIAQRVDVRLSLPPGEGAYPILAQREDDRARTGIVLATKNARVNHVPDHAKHKARPLDLHLERGLTPVTPLAARPAERTVMLNLTGSHVGYDWGLNEKVFDPNDPVMVAGGERVEVVLRNRTAMPHPIHLHGHHFQVVAIDGERFAGALRDTVLVPSDRSVTIAFDADNPGHWAFHCHQLYHMAAGMMTSVMYAGYERAKG